MVLVWGGRRIMGWFGLVAWGYLLVLGAIFVSPIFWFVFSLVALLFLVAALVTLIKYKRKEKGTYVGVISTDKLYDYNDGGGGP